MNAERKFSIIWELSHSSGRQCYRMGKETQGKLDVSETISMLLWFLVRTPRREKACKNN
jgi:hypothetical protein